MLALVMVDGVLGSESQGWVVVMMLMPDAVDVADGAETINDVAGGWGCLL